MKLFDANDIREIDAYTIKNEPVKSIDLMERASNVLYEAIKERIQTNAKIIIVCGTGNNGGDALALARMLTPEYKNLIIYQVEGKFTEDCLINRERLYETDSVIYSIKNEVDVPEFNQADFIVDGIFGTGLSRIVKDGVYAKLISAINESGAIIISIDIPSGMFASQEIPVENQYIVKSNCAVSFQFPKKAFFFEENAPYAGHWTIKNIGLHKDIINKKETDWYYVDKALASTLIKHREKYTHKGVFGHALLLAGAYGRMGAALLAAKAALRGGSGLLSAHIPYGANTIFQTSIPEVMLSFDDSEKLITSIPNLDPYSAIGVGPGLGINVESAQAFKQLLEECTLPMVIDADALNILSQNTHWLNLLPKNTILTPHPKEFERIVGKYKTHAQRIQRQRSLSKENQCIVVLKGAHTSISLPDGRIFINGSGNPGMSTAGSGDVLTGLILGLLAQSYTPEEAAILGVHLHGLSGDLALDIQSEESLMASDIIENLGKAFNEVALFV